MRLTGLQRDYGRTDGTTQLGCFGWCLQQVKAVWRGLQSKEALACLTPGCAGGYAAVVLGCEGVLTRAVVLGGETGAYKELYSHSLRGKPKAQPQPAPTAAVAVPARGGQGTLDAGEALGTLC